jgi:hypothetical protein
MYMGTSQLNTLYRSLKQIKITFFKNGKQEGKTGPVWGLGTSGKEEDKRKGCRRMSVLETLCTHI